jgi:hypothetical protein
MPTDRKMSELGGDFGFSDACAEPRELFYDESSRQSPKVGVSQYKVPRACSLQAEADVNQ